jgi:hypothetical protein
VLTLQVPYIAPVPLPIAAAANAPSDDQHSVSHEPRQKKLKAAKDKSAARAKLVRNWMEFVLASPDCFAVAKQLLTASSAFESMHYTLREKADSTLAVRLCALQRLRRWVVASGHGWPPTENLVFEYLLAHRQSAKTSASSLVSALHFAGGTLSSKLFASIALSRRLQGVASEMLSEMPPRVQALEFSPDEVNRIQELACDETAPWVMRNMAAGSLLLVVWRGRHADLGNVRDIRAEGSILAAHLLEAKTSYLDKSRLAKEMIGPLFLFNWSDWWAKFAGDRYAANIAIGEFPVVPAWDGYAFSTSPACLADFNVMLKAMCVRLMFGQVQRRSSHSCKATLMKVVSEGGCPQTYKALLAYHRAPNETAATRSYDRSRLVKPVAWLERQLSKYRGPKPECVGSDGSSAAHEDEDENGASDGHLAEEDEVAESTDDGDSSSDDRIWVATKSADSRRFVNQITSIAHCGRFGVTRKSACGKLLRAHYLPILDFGEAHRCKNCFREHQHENPTSSESSD